VTPEDQARVASLIGRGLPTWTGAVSLAASPRPSATQLLESACVAAGVTLTAADMAALAAVGRELDRQHAEQRALVQELVAASRPLVEEFAARLFAVAARAVRAQDDLAEVIEGHARGVAALRTWCAAIGATLRRTA
jgi:hypothetical protein